MITLVITNKREKCQIAPRLAYLKTSFIYDRAHISILGSVALTRGVVDFQSTSVKGVTSITETVQRQ